MHHARHINHAGEAIGKGNPQTESRKGLNCRYTPRRAGCDLRGQGSGRIFIGC
jgi:hypothetical protein